MSDLRTLFGTSGHIAVVATLKRDGRPQLSNVSYAYDRERDLLRVSTINDLAKTHNLRRDPRSSLMVTSKDGWSYAVAECHAELRPVTTDPHDASADELVSIYRAVSGGEHPDWDEFRTTMVTDRRLPLLLHVERVYGVVR